MTVVFEYTLQKDPETSGNVSEGDTPGRVRYLGFQTQGTEEVWFHSEFGDPDIEPEELGVSFHTDVRTYGSGTVRCYNSEIPGRIGTYEVIELTLELYFTSEVTTDVLKAAGFDEFNKDDITHGHVETETGTITVRYVSPEPVTGTGR